MDGQHQYYCRQLDSGCRSFVCKKNNESKSAGFVKVYNTLSNSRKELIAIDLPTELQAKTLTVFNAKNQNIKTERSGNVLYCEVEIPAFGYTTLRLEECSKPQNSLEFKGVSLLANGDCQMENNNYRIVFDGQKGGQIKSLIAKQLDHKEFVDNKHQFGFNSLRGHFYDEQKFHSNTDVPAKFTILENNELIQKLPLKAVSTVIPLPKRSLLPIVKKGLILACISIGKVIQVSGNLE